MNENIIAVIGDIHGCINTLKKLHKLISEYKCTIYSVGDLIDRGNFSKEVVEFCITEKIQPVRGNHEQMLLDAIDGYKHYIKEGVNGYSQLDLCSELDIFYVNGGQITQKSYTETIDRKNFPLLENKLSELGHLEFFRNLPIKIEFENIVITHAGIIEGMPEINMLWNRKTPNKIGKLQVFGHTPNSEVKIDEKNYINVDTGCVYGEKLTAAIIDVKTSEVKDIISVQAEIEDYEKIFL
ncbi:MAG: metallophosphoesterase [Ignavibacteria bacterium]|nr:metallophosphoesterase [Ignavibacteria bacterium]